MSRTSPRHLRTISMLALMLAVVLGVTTACTGDSKSSGDSKQAAASSSADNAKKQREELIAKGQQQAAQYDYDGAIATLSSDSSDEAKAELAKVQQAKAQAVQWADNTTIPHIFYHSLIVDPARAFGAPDGVGFSQYMVTVEEFKKELDQIYANGWVMVHPQRIAAPGPDGTMTMQPIMLPPGKKPFVLSLDDLSYYEYMEGKGFATDLFVDSEGHVVNHYTDAAGKATEGSYDVVPIVDDFVREHPDFAYFGDKGSIALTGYNGVLGYRSSVTTYGDTPQTQDAIAKAKVVADAIKAEGWHFASHSWGHINMTKRDVGTIKGDCEKWDAEVKPIVGATDELIYPFGADISGIEHYTASNPKFAYLHDTEGFSYFFPVDGTSPYWMQLDATSLRQARINIDGLTLQRMVDGKKSGATQFFNVQGTIDPARPMPVPSVGGPTAGGG